VTALLGDPALRTLLRLKLHGSLRRAGRRLRTPSGVLFAVLGLGLLGTWLFSLRLALVVGASPRLSADVALPIVRAALAGLAVVSVAGHLGHRGLFLPAQEIERLFSAPLLRSDLIRHRLHVSLGRALVGGAIVAVIAGLRLPYPWTAAAGALLFIATLTVVGQGVALVVGSWERQLPAAVLRGGAKFLGIALFVGFGALYGARGMLPPSLRLDLQTLLHHPLTAVLTAPFEPWARLMVSGPTPLALGFGALCLGLLLAALELTARFPTDFRELALATSADMAARVRRLRQGGIAGAQELRSGGGLRHWPFLLGRGPLGAIAWRKGTGIARRALATLGFSTFLLSLMVFVASGFSRGGEPQEAVQGAVFVALLGTFYLCSGLRFDFREELERMDTIKSWPLPAWKVFGAVLLPQVLLISGLLCLALTAHGLLTGADPLATAVLALFTPPFAALWLAVDNAFFLLWPVRFTPGQDGTLHNMGRAAVFVVLRMTFLAVVLGAAAAIGFAAGMLYEHFLHGGPEAALRAGLAVGFVALCCALALTVAVGGELLRRFEPGRHDS
jgi:hypothetical protein